MDERTSVIDFLTMTQQFFSHESCGQCAPCREGNLHIKLLLQKVKEGVHTESDVKLLKQIAETMMVTSLCGLGQAAQSALMAAMKHFPQTFEVK